MKLDHIMLADSGLETGIDFIERQCGVRAQYGGSHPGAGTCNALLSFGSDQYLEIIAPDPEQDITGTMAEQMSQLESPIITTWAAAVDGFGGLQQSVEDFGYKSDVIEMSRTRPDGVELEWRLLIVTGHPFGLALPFFIDWLDSPHPAIDAPGGCRLISFEVTCEQAADYQLFCEAIHLEVTVHEGEMSFRAVVDSRNGKVVL